MIVQSGWLFWFGIVHFDLPERVTVEEVTMYRSHIS